MHKCCRVGGAGTIFHHSAELDWPMPPQGHVPGISKYFRSYQCWKLSTAKANACRREIICKSETWVIRNGLRQMFQVYLVHSVLSLMDKWPTPCLWKRSNSQGGLGSGHAQSQTSSCDMPNHQRQTRPWTCGQPACCRGAVDHGGFLVAFAVVVIAP